MSADTTPIAPARFAAALKDLSVPMLHLKVLEIRNSIAHLQYSNDQLRPFAEGTSTASTTTAAAADDAAAPSPPAPPAPPAPAPATGEPDQDCVDAIRENEDVIDRMTERVALIRMEVEERGHSWDAFEADQARRSHETGPHPPPPAQTNGHAARGHENAGAPSPWTDGTFQTGTIRNGEVRYDAVPGQSLSSSAARAARQPAAQGGTLSDAQLEAALEARVRNLAAEQDGEGEKGMHL